MKSNVPNQNEKDGKKKKRKYYVDLPLEDLEEVDRLAKLHGMTRDEMMDFCLKKGIEIHQKTK